MVLVTVASAMASSGAPSSAAAAAPAKVEYKDSFTTRLPGRPSGRVFHDSLTNASDPNAKPPATAHVHTQLPAGARYDTGAVPACGASDAEIMLAGPSACPAASRVGTNEVLVDSGLPGSGRYAHEDVTFFNEPGGMIIVSHDRASGAYVVLHAKVHGGSFDLDQPPLPGTPPDGGATKSERARLLERAGPGGRSYITSPPTCPASGIWTFRYEYTFSDGRKQTATSDQRCLRRPGHRLRVRLRGLPARCTRSGFDLRVRVSGGGRLRKVDVALDGTRIATRNRRRFKLRVRAKSFASGRHRLTVAARDQPGDVASKSAVFSRCARVPARPTGE